MIKFYFALFLFLFPNLSWADSSIEGEEPQALQNQNSDIHGLFDTVFKNAYITPRGLLVTNTGLTTQVLLTISLDLYKNPDSYGVNRFSIFGGVWNDVCSCQHHPRVGQWNEFDWFAGIQLNMAKDWIFSLQYIEFLSPPGNFKPEQNIEFTLSYDDSRWQLPITFNPYIKLFWAVTGDSTVVVGKRGGTYDIELGLVPTLKLKCYPLVITLPTWITVGPSSFWNGGSLGLKNENSHFGVFSTGLKGMFTIPDISKSLGNWYIDAGVQYYYLINKNLLQAQTVTLQLPNIQSAHRSVWVAYVGFGIGY